MAKTHFKMASRTAALIGRENVSSADGALIELIKNTYDADADLCFVWINPQDDVIYVYDNGEGMNEGIIENSWMTIGTNDKQVNYSTPKGRTKSGEKGIGRFALDRLGRKCTLLTQKKGDKEALRWTIAWDDFDVDGMLLEDIEADLNRCNSPIEALIPNRLKMNIEDRAYKQGVGKKELWSNGTLLKIEHLRDKWGLSELQRLFDALEILIPPQEQADYSINFINNNDDTYETIGLDAHNDFDYRLECNFNGTEFEITLYRNEFIVDRMPADLFECEEFSKFPYRQIDFKTGIFHFQKTIEEVMSTSDSDVLKNVLNIGPFSFVFTFARLADSKDEERIQFKKVIGKTRSQWLSLYGGVKIYRDNFWVRPYGERGSAQFDWLGLDSRHAKNPQGVSDLRGKWTVRNPQSQGTLRISRIENSAIADKSSREGVIDNIAFRTLRNVLVALISIIEGDRTYIYRESKKYYNAKEEPLYHKEKGRAAAKRVLNQRNGHQKRSSISNDDVLSMAETIVSYEKQHDELMGELKLLRSLATNGLITSAITHDLKGETKTLIARADALLQRLRKNDLRDVEKGLSAISKSDAFLKSWMDTLLNQLKVDRRKRTTKNLGSVIEESVASLDPILNQKNVQLRFNNTSHRRMRLFEADINSIIYNLVINSLEEFEFEKILERAITVEIIDEDDCTRIHYADSGKGLGFKFDDPIDILRFGVSSKKTPEGEQYGTGLGMYIIDSTMSEYGGRIEFVNYRTTFELNLIFPYSK